MIYPSISAYLDALKNPSRGFKTLKGVKLKFNEVDDEPIFRASSRWLRVLVLIKGEEYILRLFTSDVEQEVMDKILQSDTMQYFKEELKVVVGGELVAFDVVLESIANNLVKVNTDRVAVVELEGMLPFYRDGLWGFKDVETGDVLVDAKYNSVGGFYEGRSVVERGGYYGLIDRVGREIVAVEYDDLSYDNSYCCYVDKEGCRGVIDRQGVELLKCEWDWIGELSMGLFLVERDGLFGYVNQRGVVVIEPCFVEATSFDRNGYAKVSEDSQSSYMIDTENNRV